MCESAFLLLRHSTQFPQHNRGGSLFASGFSPPSAGSRKEGGVGLERVSPWQLGNRVEYSAREEDYLGGGGWSMGY